MIRSTQWKFNGSTFGHLPLRFQGAASAHRAAVRRKVNDLIDNGAIVPNGRYGAYADKLVAARKLDAESAFSEAGEDSAC